MKHTAHYHEVISKHTPITFHLFGLSEEFVEIWNEEDNVEQRLSTGVVMTIEKVEKEKGDQLWKIVIFAQEPHAMVFMLGFGYGMSGYTLQL